MIHEKTRLALCEKFGSVTCCSCGLYHINFPGVSVHLNEKHFNCFVQMIQEAKQNRDLYLLKNEESKKKHLYIIKN